MIRHSGRVCMLTIGLMFLIASCAPVQGASVPLSAQQNDNATATSEATVIENPEIKPMPPTPTASLPASSLSEEPGLAPGGASENGAPESEEPIPREPATSDPGTWATYADTTYHFKISYPPHYVIKHLDRAALGKLTPSPLAAIDFRDPQNSLEIAPPEFSIRVFENTTHQPIEEWLFSTELIQRDAGWVIEPYHGQHVSGVRVLSPYLMAPGAFVYVADNTHIFQLTPLGEDPELMLDTFAIAK